METTEIMEQPVLEAVDTTSVDLKVEAESEKIIQPESEESASVPSEGSIGKFKDTASLLKAYNSLQAEFTRKCQKISELQNSLNAFSEDNLKNYAMNYFKDNAEAKEELLKGYLEEIAKSNQPPIISSDVGSGIPLKAPPKPTSLEEAKGFAFNLFL